MRCGAVGNIECVHRKSAPGGECKGSAATQDIIIGMRRDDEHAPPAREKVHAISFWGGAVP